MYGIVQYSAEEYCGGHKNYKLNSETQEFVFVKLINPAPDFICNLQFGASGGVATGLICVSSPRWGVLCFVVELCLQLLPYRRVDFWGILGASSGLLDTSLLASVTVRKFHFFAKNRQKLTKS